LKIINRAVSLYVRLSKTSQVSFAAPLELGPQQLYCAVWSDSMIGVQAEVYVNVTVIAPADA
jgi:hypothetical protein